MSVSDICLSIFSSVWFDGRQYAFCNSVILLEGLLLAVIEILLFCHRSRSSVNQHFRTFTIFIYSEFSARVNQCASFFERLNPGEIPLRFFILELQFTGS